MAKKYDVVQWVMWQMGNQGPKFGEQGHFFRAAQNAANGDLAYAVKRFSDEVHRLYGVMNLGLHKKDWLAAGEYTIADMICYPWAAGYKLRKIDLEEFPNVKRWMERMESRPAVKRAMEATLPPSAIEDANTISDEEKARRAKLLVNQRATKIPASWG
jgi:GST-like protein